MTTSDRTDGSPAEPPLDDLAEAGVYASADEGFEHGLVALAIGRPFWLMPFEGGYRLMVEPDDLAPVHEQLASFAQERARRPAKADSPVKAGPSELMTPLLWALSVVAAFRIQTRWPDLVSVGALDAGAVFDRAEAWRPFTALFLHADAAHLISNVLSGIFVFSAVLSTTNRWRGWLLLTLAAVGGNVLAAALHYPGEYRAIGASTAVFAGLGILTGHAIRRAQRIGHPRRWRTMFVPFAAGLTVLGLFGAGGIRIDVVAHTTGFIMGLGLGFTAIPLQPAAPGGR